MRKLRWKPRMLREADDLMLDVGGASADPCDIRHALHVAMENELRRGPARAGELTLFGIYNATTFTWATNGTTLLGDQSVAWTVTLRIVHYARIRTIDMDGNKLPPNHYGMGLTFAWERM